MIRHEHETPRSHCDSHLAARVEDAAERQVVERGEKDHLPLGEASRLCNEDIVGRVQQVICFAFHDSNTLLDTCMEAKMKKKIVTLFYLD